MKLYRITATQDDENHTAVWVGSQADAGKARKELVAKGFKRAEINTEEVDVPTNKEGLLAFLNKQEW